MIDRYFVETFILETISSTLTTLDPPTDGVNTLNNTLSEDTNVGVKVSGFTNGSGSVVLTDGTTFETLTFPANGELISLNTFSTITTVAVNNLTDEATTGTIELFQSTPVGSPITFRTIVGSDYRGRVSNRRRSFEEIRAGIEVNTNPILFTRYDTPIKIKDYVRAVGRTFEVMSINYPADFFGAINHQEVELLEIPDSNNP
jgi:hypothetical protein